MSELHPRLVRFTNRDGLQTTIVASTIEGLVQIEDDLCIVETSGAVYVIRSKFADAELVIWPGSATT